jgi:hypothetical protein
MIAGPIARFVPSGEWYWHVFHRAERARGLPDTEDVYQPGTFRTTLGLSAEAALPGALAGIDGAEHERMAAAALERERRRQALLLGQAGTYAERDELIARLTLAADQVLVARPTATASGDAVDDAAVTVIAGYRAIHGLRIGAVTR